MLVTLKELLPHAADHGYSVPCFNVFGHEEVTAIINTAERLNRGVILACNKDMADGMGVRGFAGMVLGMAVDASVPVCVHLDHCYDEKIIYAALRAGFTSVMFDGSQLPLQDNIRRTAMVANVAHAFGASIEGEIGSVPYSEGRDEIKSELTIPEAAAQFAQESGVDAMAIAVGNIHRLTTTSSKIDFERLLNIQALTRIPLVIHGTSGIAEADLIQLKQTRVSKFNIGTTMRMAFNSSLRETLEKNPTIFDRMTMMKPVIKALEKEAQRTFELLADDKQACTAHAIGALGEAHV